mmetsp:Transcript_29158/g.69534  ORF Transcript_29158/g.69534 Transcript_29158/m.69534 type:complete len:282 (-) Transcript_29158:51-896(-)
MSSTIQGAKQTGANSGIDFSMAARPCFWLFGDSITQYCSKLEYTGWGLLLVDAYTSEYRCADIVNRGLSGYNSRWGLMVLPKLLRQHAGEPPALVTIFFGANDCVIPEARQHVPLPEYKKNLQAMATVIRDAWPDAVVVFITPPPVDVDKWDQAKGHLTKGQRSLENAGAYAEATVEAAAAAGCASLDLFSRIKAFEGGDPSAQGASRGEGWGTAWKDCLIDGLHLAEVGNRILFLALQELVGELVPKLGATDLPIHLPHHSDIPEACPGPYLLASHSDQA